MSVIDVPGLTSVVKAIETEFSLRPPAICVIGVSGVGKSRTVNAMFGTKLTVSATTRGTHRFSNKLFEFDNKRLDGLNVKCALRVYDAPGLGEDVRLDENYLERYKRHLPKCDVALWVIAARNRAVALDQMYLERLADVLPETVLAINQVDLIDPLDWNRDYNLPSRSQEKSMAEIAADRREKLSASLGKALPSVAYSALKYYNLQKLFAECVKSAPAPRRWMFEILKAFSSRDWLDRAEGLPAEARDGLAKQYIKTDAGLGLAAIKPLLTSRTR